MDHLLPSPGTHFTRRSQAPEIGLTWQHSPRWAGYKCAFWQEWRLKLASPALLLLLSSLCPYVNKLFQTNRGATDRDWGFNEKKTEAEMKHWLPIQIAVITTSTLKLCNNLCSIALLRWEDKKKKERKINAYLQCFWINISLWFRIIIFWSHFKKAGDYTLITYCVVGERLGWWWIKVRLLAGKWGVGGRRAALYQSSWLQRKEANESE